ncbi:hypothetical protein QTP81_16850 [Alteromonas sp. ASW11-36]|uniref:Uncharacterized protein n=1 Tax=Alteromonas arenosi TaxID=3055817 RepID=A0ABT7T1G1_9ALTE|nr:hypothetical protein [Alteromonas sp. ASW11-36]MDM7862278.1 hypothetical protein [Alteromonas sp. ASW11-36]
MEAYLIRAAKVLKDPEQTITAKQTALEVLRNAGFSDADIKVLQSDGVENDRLSTVIFLA